MNPERCCAATEHRPADDDTSAADKLDDDTYPAYSMGRAAEILGVTQAFLRGLDAAHLLTPQRSSGGHRRYSRYQLRIAGRVRELVDTGNTLEAACRIVILEDQLAEAQRLNTDQQHALDNRTPTNPSAD
ncbi:helix-turn-helix domain-containing protein [Nocardia sp. NPDC050175]|uniref:helix-turn-helix domain-containing protein n=1 Tax=Nocardia sp. NPDC050175 TaxID=3364317 RepID=UPI0037973083